MRLRPATPADLSLLRHWDEQPHVVASDPNDDWQWEHELVRQVDWGEVAANLRAIDIWIGEAAYLGQGHGTTIMKLALARCFADPQVKAVIIDPLAGNTRARRFYERLGFVAVERRQFGADDCVVYRLERAAWSTGQGSRSLHF